MVSTKNIVKTVFLPVLVPLYAMRAALRAVDQLGGNTTDLDWTIETPNGDTHIHATSESCLSGWRGRINEAEKPLMTFTTSHVNAGAVGNSHQHQRLVVSGYIGADI